MVQLGSVVLALGITASFAHATPRATTTRTILQKRAVFDLVSVKTQLRDVCAGHEPLAVEYKRSAGDVAAAVFTGLWYTPVHLRVTCASD
jgi:hypothetical protein